MKYNHVNAASSSSARPSDLDAFIYSPYAYDIIFDWLRQGYLMVTVSHYAIHDSSALHRQGTQFGVDYSRALYWTVAPAPLLALDRLY